jgi:spermidine synthase
MLGHLPGLLHPRPRSVLIVGFGAGVTAGSFVNHPTVERIVICEIEPLIPRVVAKYFAAQNFNIVDDSRVQIIYDDARHYLLTTNEKFDVISSDPIHPWVKGAAALYTREYFDLVRRHLNPGGIVSQWVPLYSTSMDAVKSEMATFFESFPGGTVWSNERAGKGYDIVLLGGDSVQTINADEVQQRLNRRDHVNVVKSLRQVGFGSALELLGTYAGRAPDLAPWLAGAEINRDLNLRLQYLAGMGLNLDERDSIYESIMKHRQVSSWPFAGSQETLETLRRMINRLPPRTLTQTQAAAILHALADGPVRHIAISAVTGDDEGLQYATQLGQAITAAGWNIELRQSVFSDRVAGLLIFVGAEPPPPEANELFRALQAAGLNAPGHLDRTNPGSVLLVVGARE